MLLPFWPLKPHLFAGPRSPDPSPAAFRASPFFVLRPGVGGPSWTRFGLPPRMAETEESGDLAFFWIADVIAMHSDITKDAGSTATDTGRLLYCMREDRFRDRLGRGVPGTERRLESMAGGCFASRLMLQMAGYSR